MKTQSITLVNLILATILLTSIFLVAITTSQGEYDPWKDLNDDGWIELTDFYELALAFGTSGTPIEKASIEYDSGWIDITDKAGQYFNISHNLNSTDIFLDISGKTTSDGGVHQKHVGGTGYIPGWHRVIGEANDYNSAYSVVSTSDGGYALAGSTQAGGAGGHDFLLIKIDRGGFLQWLQIYGGINADDALSMVQTGDGGYALAGYTMSSGAGLGDFWLVKTDAVGNMEWNQTYGGDNYEQAYSVIQTFDGGYALAGYTSSFGAGQRDFWLVKTNASGNMQWNMTYGRARNDEAFAVVQTSDYLGYVIAGQSVSMEDSGTDLWLVKTYTNGSMQWNQTYGGLGEDVMGDAYYIGSAIQANDEGIVMAGRTDSFGAGDFDFYLVKTDVDGNMEWNQTYGGAWEDSAADLVQTSDGDYAVAGYTTHPGVGRNFCLVKIDASGSIGWSTTYTERGNQRATSIVQAADGGFLLAGWTGTSPEGIFLLKTGTEVGLALTDSTADTITLYRGATDLYWNYVRVRVWKPKETP